MQNVVKPQKAVWERMKAATDYAAALADPELRAYYEAQAKKVKMQPRNLAIADYYKRKTLLSKETGLWFKPSQASGKGTAESME